MRTPLLATTVLLVAITSFGQSSLTRFEVASIRPIPESELVPSVFTLGSDHGGGQFKSTTTLYGLVRRAYNLPQWSISGMKSEQSFYAIAATMNPAASEEDFRVMLQQLLADRFAFVAHRETREVSGYRLIVDSSGSKLKTVTPAGEAPPMPEYLKGVNLPEGRVSTLFIGGVTTMTMTGRGVPVSKLIDAISGLLVVPIEDRTGLTDNYYFGFKFSRDANPAADTDLPSIFSAVQDELGLKLEKQKVPLEILVVDKVNKIPSDN